MNLDILCKFPNTVQSRRRDGSGSVRVEMHSGNRIESHINVLHQLNAVLLVFLDILVTMIRCEWVL